MFHSSLRARMVHPPASNEQRSVRQFRTCEQTVKELNKTVADKQFEIDVAHKELGEVRSELQQQKDINEQVRKQIFAEREAGEDTINQTL